MWLNRIFRCKDAKFLVAPSLFFCICYFVFKKHKVKGSQL